MNSGGEPEYLDPGKSDDGLSTSLVMQMFEGLTTYDPRDLHPVQGVATHWEQSADNRVFRFHLRPDARWSDGRPVTAGDFVYAWKRVVTPRTASKVVDHLKPLLNAELFSQGKLLVLREPRPLLAEPRAGATAGELLAKGQAVEVLARSPMRVTTAIAPLPSVPPGVTLVTHTKEDASAGTAEALSLGAGASPASAVGHGWKGKRVNVLRAGPRVDCDGVEDRWFLVEQGGARGYLPGCLLASAGDTTTFALVARHDRMPTYRPSAGMPASEPPPVTGFIDERDLSLDDAVIGVHAADDLTLDVELERPTPYFLDLTGLPTLAPVRRDVLEPFERRGDDDLWTRPESIVTNGPYTLDTWKFRYEITMKPNPYYWNRDKLKIRRIVWVEVEEYHATLNLYKAAEIDYIGDSLSLPAEYLSRLSSKRDFSRNLILFVYWFELNTKNPPLNDVRVRRALNLAIDKAEIVARITRGDQLPATHFVPDYTGLGYAEQAAADKAAGTDPFAGPLAGPNPELARALMKEAGYDIVRDGDGYRAVGVPPIEILYNTSEGHRAIAVAIQDMWKRNLGISVTLRNEEWKVMLKSHRDGHFQVVRGGWQADYNHPLTFLEQFLSNAAENQSGWGDPAFDDLVRKATSTADRAEGIKLYRKAEAMAVAAMPRIPLYFYTRSNLVKPWVKGFWGNWRSQHLVQFLWIDPAWQEHRENVPAYEPAELPPPGILSEAAVAP